MQIIIAVVVGTCMALPQRRALPSDREYQPAPPNQDQYQPPAAPQTYQEPRIKESTTFIPIIRFDKEQGEDGSYKAA